MGYAFCVELKNVVRNVCTYETYCLGLITQRPAENRENTQTMQANMERETSTVMTKHNLNSVIDRA